VLQKQRELETEMQRLGEALKRMEAGSEGRR
jgi:hypothetical protein